MSPDEAPQMEDVGCPLGCIPSDERLFSARDRLHGLSGEFTLVRCKHCGLIRTNPRPTPETIGQYYPADYGPYLGTKVVTQRTAGRSRLAPLKRLARWFLNQNACALPQLAPGRALEIGCASGSFMYFMARQGWDVEGIEYSPAAAESARQLGFTVHAGSLESAPSPDQPYDLVVGWMVLEHLHDPVGCLRKLGQWVRPGGWIALSVPNAGALEARIFRDRWYALQVPTHLYHFTPESVEKLLLAGGWQLDRVFHQRVLSNLFASMGYCLRDAGWERLGRLLLAYPERAGRWSYLLQPLAWLLALVGQTGRMTIWARVVK